MSDTPKTDDAETIIDYKGLVDSEFARELERENAKLRAAGHALTAFVDVHSDVAAVIKWNGGKELLEAFKMRPASPSSSVPK